ncbi:unnamed protein product [Sphenostylis stenocarpa]|uniref:Uncharacterized protein n=1 Tax=Sphenostylis stenocarpa TaxID=92480 RepID=A0AA86VLP1_9FABA|nr:unnamed protein product [Sphenostylis stenocarpa]
MKKAMLTKKQDLLWWYLGVATRKNQNCIESSRDEDEEMRLFPRYNKQGMGNAERRRSSLAGSSSFLAIVFSVKLFSSPSPGFSRNLNTLSLNLPSAEIYPLSHSWVSSLH